MESIPGGVVVMKYADMPTGMLEGKIYTLIDEIGYLEARLARGSDSRHWLESCLNDEKKNLKAARAELAKRKQSLETHDFIKDIEENFG